MNSSWPHRTHFSSDLLLTHLWNYERNPKLANIIAYVPAQKLSIAQFSREVTRIEDDMDNTEVKGWLTKISAVQKGKGTPWALRVFSARAEEVNHTFPGLTQAHCRNVGCVNGIALVDTDVTISTVDGTRRPSVLYRAIHGGQPHGGIISRLGHGSDAVFFHHHLRRHLSWISREPSPFLSATTDFQKAVRVACIYVAKGYEDVQIVEFRTGGAGWDHKKHRMWEPRSLVKRLSPEDDHDYFDKEFLIEHSIPKESITDRYIWNEDKKQLDPSGDNLDYAKNVQRNRKRMKEKRRKEAKKAKEAKERRMKRKAEEEAEKKRQEVQSDETNDLMKKRPAEGLGDAEEQEQEKRPRKRYKVGQKLTYKSRN
ncbi:hypothetical protein CkaCkLH20_04194 [Colletotrichum karsti]|uniref:DUF7587 domain-containing protein n=1 Tax=Colletotrichum karsti TaxID=1095194 RepID=A0A9P6IAF6_9PEZI|nr:uncharacterized protein CkaCkLH20_04194 [Colletotrichum karsti]KAF9878156.1 hypothetical protein CkaCkLH20_04194 [Colletotrichum karsti]